MLDIGFSEILLFGIIALVVLGPEKLPIAIRTAGRWYANLRRMVTNVQRDIEQELKLTEIREQMQQELTRLKEMEHSMQEKLDQLSVNLQEMQHYPANQIHPSFATPPAFGLMLWLYQANPARVPFLPSKVITMAQDLEETVWELPGTTHQEHHSS